MKNTIAAAMMMLSASAVLAQGAASTTVHTINKDTHTFTLSSEGSGMWRISSQGAGEDPQGKAKDDLFTGTEVFEKNATSVTDVNMGPNSLGMVGGRNASQARGMVLNTVRTYEYDAPGMYNLGEVDKFRQKLSTGDWSCSVHTRNLKTGESTDVCQKARSDGFREDAIITVEKKELTFIHHIYRVGGANKDGGGATFVEPSLFMVPGALTAELTPLLNTGMLHAELRALVNPGTMAAMRAETEANMAELRARLKAMGALNSHEPLHFVPPPAFNTPAHPEAPASPAKPLE